MRRAGAAEGSGTSVLALGEVHYNYGGLTPRPAQRRGDGLLVREAPRGRVAESY